VAPEPAPSGDAPAPGPPATEARAVASGGAAAAVAAPAGEETAEPAPEPASEPAPEPARAPVAITLEEVVELWPAVVETLQADQSLLAAALAGAQPVEVREDGTLIVAFGAEDSFNRRMAADNAEHRQAVLETVRSLTGAPLRVEYETRELEAREAAPELAGDELVDRIVETFDAEEIVPGEEPAGESAGGEAPVDGEGADGSAPADGEE
jgi:hypothetical protein